MKPKIPSVDRQTSSAEVTRILLQHGCVIIENAIPAQAMDTMMSDLKPWFDERDIGSDDFSGYKTQRVSSLVARSEIARDIALHKTVLGLCDEILLPNCEVYRLHVTHMVNIGPGEIRQEVHRDDSIYPAVFHDALPELNTLVHGMWAVTDFTADNGATTMVPGSHLWDRARKPEEHEITQAVMPKGSVALYLGSTFHGGGQNRSNAHRVGALFGYALGWLRQEENMYLACPPEVAKSFPESLQRLIGYDQFTRGAGWVDNANPQILLKDGATFDEMRLY